jgi:hypothetical protein
MVIKSYILLVLLYNIFSSPRVDDSFPENKPLNVLSEILDPHCYFFCHSPEEKIFSSAVLAESWFCAVVFFTLRGWVHGCKIKHFHIGKVKQTIRVAV